MSSGGSFETWLENKDVAGPLRNHGGGFPQESLLFFWVGWGRGGGWHWQIGTLRFHMKRFERCFFVLVTGGIFCGIFCH